MDTNPKPARPDDATAPLNQVFLMGSIITDVSYGGTAEVSPGQPVEGNPTRSRISGGWQIDFTCGRQGTPEVAHDFLNECGGSSLGVYGLETAFDSTPSLLNFFFSISITFAGQSSPVTLYLGQGHIPIGGENNWWFGGRSMSNGTAGGGPVVLDLPGGTVTVSGVGDHTFTFS
jgi:hypothetical protein